jgi:penicillin-binding protein 2
MCSFKLPTRRVACYTHRMMPSPSQLDSPRRAVIAGQLIFMLLLLLLALRMVELQVTNVRELAAASEENRFRRVRLTPPRGEIFDRHGQPLVVNEPIFDIGLLNSPSSPPQGEELTRLSALLGLAEEELLTRFKSGRSYPYEPAILLTTTSRELLTRVEEGCYDRLVIIPRSQRRYLTRTVLAHAFGYLDEVRAEELSPRYRLGELLGRKGLEAFYEETLAGIPGEELVEVDAGERRMEVAGQRVEPIAGNHLVLGIDLTLQRRAEEILAGRRGSIAVMNVHTGELYALATSPTYDPNRLGDSAYWGELVTDPEKPLLARVYQSTYPPGSVFKLVDATAGLLMGKVAPDGKMDQSCGGTFVYGDTAFHCWGHIGHGHLPLTEAIGWSCNVYFYQLGLRLGIEGIREYGEFYGLNESTGIDLPHERAGELPSIEKLEERWGQNWPRGQICNNAIGQGSVLVSPLEMLSMYAAIANGGTLLSPRLVNRVMRPDGRLLEKIAPVVRRELDLPGWVRETLITGLRNVLRRFGANPHDLCGKTGTSENPHGEPHAWFCAFAPSTEPEVAIVIMIENGGFGESYIKYAKELVGYVLDNELTERPAVSYLDFRR